ncbi:C-C motif chemokine 20-like [Mantella aurantiaca]
MFCASKEMDHLPAKKISILVAVAVVLCVLGNAHVTFDCCYLYYKRPIPVKAIRSYTTQRSNEVCHINAIIFKTKKGKLFCADINDEWVKKAIKFLAFFPAHRKEMNLDRKCFRKPNGSLTGSACKR